MCTSERVMFNVLKPEIYLINNQNSRLTSQKNLSHFFSFFLFFLFFVVFSSSSSS